MLRKLVVLVLFGVLLVGGIAYSQPTVLSETQLEDAKGGCWAVCDQVYNCLGGIGCQVIWPNASKLLMPYLRYVCRFILYPASCSNFAYGYCGEIKYFVDTTTCDPAHQISVETHNTNFCGVYP